MCDKLTFDTRHEAVEAMRTVPIKATGQVPYRVYRCPSCKKFHYSSKSPMKRRN